MTDRKKPSTGFWITVALVAVLAYPLSFGPACWIDARINLPDAGRTVLMYFYLPLLWNANYGPAWIQRPLVWWKDFGKPMEMMVMPEPTSAEPDIE